MQEQAHADGERVRFSAVAKTGQNIRLAGEDIARDGVVPPAGAQLGPAQLGLAARWAKPIWMCCARCGWRCCSLATNWPEPGETLTAGKIYNSNRYWLRGLLEALGCQVRDLGIIPDSLAATRLALADAAATSDVGADLRRVSVGEDHVKRRRARRPAGPVENRHQNRASHWPLAGFRPCGFHWPAGQPGVGLCHLLAADCAVYPRPPGLSSPRQLAGQPSDCSV